MTGASSRAALLVVVAALAMIVKDCHAQSRAMRDEATPVVERPSTVQSPDETSPPEKKDAAKEHEPKQPVAQQGQQQKQQRTQTAKEISAKETVASSLLRTLDNQTYEMRSLAEFMPAEKYGWRPAHGDYGDDYPGYGPKELRTFGEQIKHVACANFAFSAELDGKAPPAACDTGGPSAAKSRDELVAYLRDSHKALHKSIQAITQKNMFDPIEGPYAGPNTRLGIAHTAIWHLADHYGQLVIYMRLNGIVPPASRRNPPELKD